MVEIGDIAVKTVGREKGKICAVVDKIDSVFVLIDGDVRRKKCNIAHLKFKNEKIKIKKKEATASVKDALKKAGYKITEKKQRTKEQKEKLKKPVSKRTQKIQEKQKSPKKQEKPKKPAKASKTTKKSKK